MAEITYDAEVSSPAGVGELLLKKFDARESLSTPFQYELFLLSKDSSVDFSKMVGKNLTVTVTDDSGKKFYYNGNISNFSQAARDDESFTEDERTGYRATLVPWLWFLTRSSDCRIFQKMAVPDIISKIFNDHGFSDFKKSLQGKYAEREYCVQYQETDFDFVSRLMEEEGIYYYFEHADKKHTMVMMDSSSGHTPIATPDMIYRDKGAPGTENHVKDWVLRQEIQSGECALMDYDFEAPKKDLMSKNVSKEKHDHADMALYDFPGRFTETKDGENYAKHRLEAHLACHEICEGKTENPNIRVGFTFDLKEHPRRDQNRKYMITETAIKVAPEKFGSAGSAGSGMTDAPVFSCDFTSIVSTRQYRPLMKTPRPRVTGPQSALVVGKKGEEIWTDKYGRIKVQFPWDRQGKKDEKSSCWIRVAQGWAGNKWGQVVIPRIGQEVLVEFLSGDPDRPIITGSVYNADLMPPYGLPDNQTQSGLKTHSTKDGTAETFNELRFEDKKGEEEIYFHAEKNFNRVVENDDTLKVGFDVEDKGDRTVEINNNETITIGNSKSDDGSQTITIWKDRTATLEEGDDTLKVAKGDQSIDVKKKILIKAGDQITLECGQSKIVLKKDGTITIDGMEFKVTAKSKIDLNSKGDLKAKGMKSVIEGTMLDLKGSATTNVKGGIVKIN